ncbi:MAG: MBL fold metallo-hydrolase [Bacteroidota bacterium]|nr:MBL fold metallo-hydrolase [Bacteroidota bacterium]
MRKLKLHLIFLLILFVLSGFQELSAQMYDKKEGGGLPDPQLSQKDNDYLDRQAKVFLDTVQSVLSKYSPVVHDNFERTTAKLLMDAVFHEHFAVYRRPVQEFFHARVNQVIRELETTKVEKGVRIWKVYDMGFIARTKTVTLAFDLVSGITSQSEDFAMNQDEIQRIVRQCDALLITHRHEDHADLKMAQQFIALGLPVLATEETWPNDPVYSKIIHPERVAEKLQQLKLKKYILGLYVYPGHQLHSAINNVYLVKTPEGITLAHIGDQINEGDFMIDYDWIDQVAKKHHVDVFMPNAWTMDIFRIARGFNPELILPGHELELGHTVWDRLPFWGDDKYLELNYAELKASKYPVVVLIWGESYLYIPNKFIK